MRTGIVWGSGVVVSLALVAASAFAASSGWKRYTLPAARPAQVSAPGTLTARFPAEWHVKTAWVTPDAPNGNPFAHDRVHEDVWWSVNTMLEPTGATIGDVRRHMLGWAGKTVWGEGTPTRVYVGDSYVTLPMGKVWRLTLALVPQKGQTRFRLSYQRDYVLDRGVVVTAGGAERHLFDWFTVQCSARTCKTHNGQLAAIMRSIRIRP